MAGASLEIQRYMAVGILGAIAYLAYECPCDPLLSCHNRNFTYLMLSAFFLGSPAFSKSL
jgi:hypothetical protein